MSDEIKKLYTPQQPISVPLRPINKGMMRHIPSTLLPQGALLTAKNMIVGTNGPKRRPAISQYGGGTAVYFPPIRGMVMLTETDGTRKFIAFDSRWIYEVDDDGVTEKLWDYTNGTLNCSAGALTISGLGTPNWSGTAADINAGDVVVVGSGATLERLVIGSVDATNLITLASATSYAHTSTSYQIGRALRATTPYLVDWASFRNQIVFADTTRPLFKYTDSGGFTEFDSSLSFIPTCVCFWKDRLWCGHVKVGSTDYRQRIIWSTVTDETDLDPTGRYVEFPYTYGAVKRLVGLGELLIAYFDDAIWWGRQTNIAGDTLPVSFDKLESGNIGLIGMAAVTPFLDGHFFVGQDDIYFFSPRGLERVGTPIVTETIDQCEYPWAIYAAHDTTRGRIVFGFPSNSTLIEKVWSYDYKAKAWSYDEIGCSALAGLSRVDSSSWDDATGTWGSPDYPRWDAAEAGEDPRLFLGRAGVVYEVKDGLTTDESNASIPIELVTPDFDDGAPDLKKTTRRLSIKIDRVLSSDLTFNVYWSTDRGRNWTSAGTCTIDAGDDETYIDFLATGSTVRFRLTSDSQVEEYTIQEIVRRVVGRGMEIHLGPSD